MILILQHIIVHAKHKKGMISPVFFILGKLIAKKTAHLFDSRLLGVEQTNHNHRNPKLHNSPSILTLSLSLLVCWAIGTIPCSLQQRYIKCRTWSHLTFGGLKRKQNDHMKQGTSLAPGCNGYQRLKIALQRAPIPLFLGKKENQADPWGRGATMAGRCYGPKSTWSPCQEPIPT